MTPVAMLLAAAAALRGDPEYQGPPVHADVAEPLATLLENEARYARVLTDGKVHKAELLAIARGVLGVPDGR